MPLFWHSDGTNDLRGRFLPLARKRPRLRAKYSGAGLEEVPLLYLGEEEDFYEGENRDMVLSVLTEAAGEPRV